MPGTEAPAVAAAMLVVKRLRNVQLSQYRPEQVKAAGGLQSERERLRDENLVKLLEAIAAAGPLAAGRRSERVTANGLTALTKTTDTYRKRVAQLRMAFEPLDPRMRSLGEEAEFAAMAANYNKARCVVDAGHGPEKDVAAPAA